jgi:hypothetical protein
MQYARPPFRPLRAYAFNPASDLDLDQAIGNEVSLMVPWEDLQPGPVGEYVEVVDFDRESECFYLPVDLNAPPVLVQSGLSPAEGDPQFHQQMAYAWVMSTVRHFERGLGRTVLWSPHLVARGGEKPREQFVRRLRIYPHALRAPQAYYSPAKKALLLGYFPLETVSAGALVHTTFFTCLSHAVAAHETAHAILDGLMRTVDLTECGTDELAVQEALADLAGLFQHFALAGFLRDQIRLTSDLDENQRLLQDMARRLAQPVGIQAELRKQIGASAKEGQPSPQAPRFQERASLLVAAVFEAFTAMWRRRCGRLLALGGNAANGGQRLTGELLDGVAAEAASCASHFLQMCIRAIDYCPPVNVTFGDFLRAMLAADADLFAQDQRRYRVALVEAFRRHGLYPQEIGTLSPLHPALPPPPESVTAVTLGLEPKPAASREQEFERETEWRERLHARWLSGGKHALTPEAARAMGLALDAEAPGTIARSSDGLPRASVDSCRLARRTGDGGKLVSDWVITITQQRKGYFDPTDQAAQDAGDGQKSADFTFRGGCTLLVDTATGAIRLCVAKDILADDRLARTRESVQRRRLATARGRDSGDEFEPFSALRSGQTVAPLQR